MGNPFQWASDQFAVRAAESAAVESQLPGRRNGPADTYRHLIWSAELTRKFGEPVARAILDGHEVQGSASPDPNGEKQSSAEEAMDRHNNEIGIRLGKDAKTFDDVVKRAQETIDSSRGDGDAHNGKGAIWLERGQWQKNPKDDAGQELPPEKWNWGDRVDWKNGTVKEPYVYPHGGQENRHDAVKVPPGTPPLTFPEDGMYPGGTDPHAGEDRRSDATDSVGGLANEAAETQKAMERVNNEEQPTNLDSRIQSMRDLAAQPIDQPAQSALLKPVDTWTESEMKNVLNSAQGDFTGANAGDPLKAHLYEKVQDWHTTNYGEGEQQYEGGKPVEPQPIRAIPEEPVPHLAKDGGDLWQASARMGDKLTDIAQTDGYEPSVKALQDGINMLNDANPARRTLSRLGRLHAAGPAEGGRRLRPQDRFRPEIRPGRPWRGQGGRRPEPGPLQGLFRGGQGRRRLGPGNHDHLAVRRRFRRGSSAYPQPGRPGYGGGLAAA